MDAFEIKPLKSKTGSWVLALGAEELRLASASDDTVILMSRQDAEQQLEVLPLWAGEAAMTLRRLDQGKLEFRLDAHQHSKLNSWLGPPSPARLRTILKKRFAFSLILGALLIFISLPLDGDTASGIPPVPFDVVSFVLGVGLVCFWVLSRVRPTRVLFAASAGWFLLLAADVLLDMVSGRSSPLSLLWVPLCLWFAWAQFNQFRSLSPGRASVDASQAA